MSSQITLTEESKTQVRNKRRASLGYTEFAIVLQCCNTRNESNQVMMYVRLIKIFYYFNYTHSLPLSDGLVLSVNGHTNTLDTRFTDSVMVLDFLYFFTTFFSSFVLHFIFHFSITFINEHN